MYDDVRLPSLEDFLDGGVRNAYVVFGPIRSYHVKGPRVINGVRMRTLTRGNTVNENRPDNAVRRQNYQRTGLYKALDDLGVELARERGYEAMYVESVANRFLPDVLLRYGYTQVDTIYGGLPSFYKLL